MTITELREGVFYAELGFEGGVTVSARPSDAIALAMRSGATIRCEEAVLERGRHRHPGRAGGRGREVPRVPRHRSRPEDFEQRTDLSQTST